MIDAIFVVDGIDIRFVKFEIYEEQQFVQLYTTARYHKVSFDQMPTFLSEWIPKNVEGAGFYDHIGIECGIINNGVPPKPITPLQQLASMFLPEMEAGLKDMEYIRKQMQAAIINVKDLGNKPGGANINQQSNTIAKLADIMLKTRVVNMQYFNTAAKLLKEDNKDTKQLNNGKSNNDYEKD